MSDLKPLRKRQKIDRNELYQEVWSVPAVRLRKKYGISDSMLAKICKQLEVPKPAPGYWQQLKAGKGIQKPALPKLASNGAEEYDFRTAHKQLDEAAEEKLKEKLILKVPDRLTKPHRLIKEARAILLEKGNFGRWHQPGDYLLSEKPHLDIRVSKSTLPRALRIIDTFIKTLEARGHKVVVNESRPDETLVYIDREDIQFSLCERRTEKPGKAGEYPAVEYESTGRLCFELGYRTFGHRRTFNDGKRNKVEDWLGEIVLTIEDIARLAAIKREEDRTESLKWEERQRKLEVERKSVERLHVLSAVFEKVRRIERFISALEDKKGTNISPELSDWLRWAKGYVSDRDPLLWSDKQLLEVESVDWAHRRSHQSWEEILL